eukprot:gnl/TRDRNA2_/TRDRNA2_153928_c1_seq2.p1 gnl/TRDRNA2_/TRDRNA2_153928_c1~~gnl/TRDRNA2_/TRDRNA2_153928_c1_seq2.p1  ORF type:complete len:112 (-),score=14.02 gnl/TRDRNA2_/TRDRNA2_153928_c1_seq2:45-380(-)
MRMRQKLIQELLEDPTYVRVLNSKSPANSTAATAAPHAGRPLWGRIRKRLEESSTTEEPSDELSEKCESASSTSWPGRPARNRWSRGGGGQPGTSGLSSDVRVLVGGRQLR